MRILFNVCKFIIIFFLVSTTNANKPIKSGACNPYFVSLKVNEANSHVGPDMKYKNANKYQIKCTPLLVIAIYDTWRKIKDMDGSTGWLQQSQLSNKRYVMVKKPKCILFETPDTNGEQINTLKREVVMEVTKANKDWCFVKLINKQSGLEGYVQRKDVFGLLDNEACTEKFIKLKTKHL